MSSLGDRRAGVQRRLRRMEAESLQEYGVDVRVEIVGNGLAYKVTLPELDQVPREHTAPEFARYLVYRYVGPPDRTFHMAMDRSAGDGVILLDWDTVTDRKRRRIVWG